MFQRLRTIVYAAPDLAKARDWYREVLGQDPYFDEPYYVGFDVHGCELGLDPDAPKPAPTATITYWSVPDAELAYARLLALGAQPHQPVRNVGGDIYLGAVLDPFGNVVGVISEG